MKVYLSGPITNYDFDAHLCNGWRKEAKNFLEIGNWTARDQREFEAESSTGGQTYYDTGIKTYSPLRGKVYLKNVGAIDGEYDGPLTNRHAITMRDRHDCLTCDAMLVYLKGTDVVSIGTMIELGWADAVRKPIVLVMEPGNVHEHVIAGSIPVACVETLEEGCDVIKRILLP